MTQAFDSADLVIFGGTGDLSLRKLLPALYRLQRAGRLEGVRHIIGTGRQAMNDDAYRAEVERQLLTHLFAGDWDADVWNTLAAKISFVRVDASSDSDFRALVEQLQRHGTSERIFYLATLPSLYSQICHQLQASGALGPRCRVVLEKPIGHDLASCHAINEQVQSVFAEADTFRIDHYLGKETVQNLLALRFGNTLLYPLWNNIYIDHVQITVAEDIGVGGRAGFYAITGALRDMVQNHLLQVLSMVAMEPPGGLSADSIRDEKVKVLKALLPYDAKGAKQHTVRGQYAHGAINGESVSGFFEEIDDESCHHTETFVALRVPINNWRWAGVPFYLRTGKRMTRRFSEIVVQFRKHPFSLFPGDPNDVANKLVISLQPEEDITLHILNKKPGLTQRLRLHPVTLDLVSHPDKDSGRYDAYERLLLDIIAGDQTLFMRNDEIETAWAWIEGIIHAWEEADLQPLAYAAGTMGPNAALALPEREGRSWHE